MIRFSFLAFLFLALSQSAYAACTLTPTATPFPGYDDPLIYPHGAINLTLSCNAGEDTSFWGVEVFGTNGAYLTGFEGSGSTVTYDPYHPFAAGYKLRLFGRDGLSARADLYLGKKPVGTASASRVYCLADGNSNSYEAHIHIDGLDNPDRPYGYGLWYAAEVTNKPTDATVFLTQPSTTDDDIIKVSVSKSGAYTFNVWAVTNSHVSVASDKLSYTVEINPENCGGYDFVLQNAKLGQVLYDPKENSNNDFLSVVEGKPFGLILNINAQNVSDYLNTPVPVRATFTAPGYAPVLVEGTFNVADLEGHPEGIEVTLMHDGSPFPLGMGNAVIEINPEGGIQGTPSVPEIDKTDNSKPFNFYGQLSQKLEIGLFTLEPGCPEGQPCFRSPGDQSLFGQKIRNYAQGLFPTPEVSLSPAIRSFSTDAADALDDSLSLDWLAFLTRPGTDTAKIYRYFAIAPAAFESQPGYFEFIGGQVAAANGFHYNTLWNKVAVVKEDLTVTASHELIHTFDICYDRCWNIFDWEEHYLGSELFSGFWAENVTNKKRNNLRTLMTRGRSPGDSRNENAFWMDSFAYSQLLNVFRYGGFKNKIAPADHILVSGILSNSGEFTFAGTLKREILPPDGSGVGRGVMSIRDPNGVELGLARFSSEMEAEVEFEDGVQSIPQERVPVSALLPFPGSAASVLVSVNGAAPTKVVPHSSLLKRAIEAVPDRGFVANPAVEREKLLAEVGAIDGMFEVKSYQSAYTQIQSVLRPHVLAVITDTFAKESPLEFNQTDVLQLIDSLLPRMTSLRSIVPFPTNGLIELRLGKDAYSNGEKIAAEVHVKKAPLNSDFEFFAEVSLNSKHQKTEQKRKNIWMAESERLVAGLNTVSGSLFIRDKRLSSGLKQSISRIEEGNLVIRRQIDAETDPERIASLEREFAVNLEKLQGLKTKLKQLGKKVGSDVQILLEVL